MNILSEDAVQIADAVHQRIARGGGTWTVYASMSGLVAMDKLGDVRRSYDLPENFMIGRYTKAAGVEDILDDIVQHRTDLFASIEQRVPGGVQLRGTL
ncbi:hypothetical protein AB8810_12820 [Xanthomonas sp. NCPPB 3005]|uniref:hypothetical protein n=1 Tax=Xanthomonas sp. NCPPB 3005 TaxID=3240913 RepID=UPI0035146DD4